MEDQNQERTYGIWGLLALFVLIGAVGLYLVFTLGAADRTPTEPRPAQPGPVATDSTTTVPQSDVTFLDGSAVPEEIFEVVAEPGRHVYLYTLPDGFTDEITSSVVAPTLVSVADDGLSVTLVMTCAVSADSVPAAVRVSEDPFEVNVMAVAIGHPLGDPCPEGEELTTLTIPLESPMGSRRVVLSRPGESVELGGLG